MEAKPLQIVPSSHNNTYGGGSHKKINMENGEVGEEGKRVVVVVKEEEENPLKITTCHHNKCCLFTEAQRRELDYQVFIFNHFAYNLPISHCRFQFPTNMSECTRLGSDYATMVDSEPQRCRRTDGKKWRCSKNTLPNQKYCERHMHRGRNRSRKLVETAQVNSCLTTTKPSSKSHENSLVIQHSDTFSYTPSRSFCVVNTSSDCNRSRNVIDSDNYHTSFSAVVNPCSTLASAVKPKVTTFGSTESVTSDNTSRDYVCKQDEQTKGCIGNDTSIKSRRKGSISCEGNGVSTGIGFSPKSVLQVSGCNASYLNHSNNSTVEPEPGRCRRTDGKKWRCKSAVLPGQKYCATHMHRGAKRRFTNNESPPSATGAATTATITSEVTIARLPYPSAATNIQKAYCTIPNTKLSMSVPESEPFIKCNEKSGSCSDTDTSTTITDTINECSYVSF
ncbi:growth-regulating factor 9 [Cicer arietinum]|uniref:Growth-regulating factor n=1 Tax=Cicer arietinum TaxID=3827 RepID=A0A1S2YWA3_CICAR|nr:growth-regulating factor 9 [Cicer arietinum]